MTCPLCQSADCRGYPFMWEQLAAGRNPDHWRQIHDQLNSPDQAEADAARAAALTAAFPPAAAVPLGRPCGGC